MGISVERVEGDVEKVHKYWAKYISIAVFAMNHSRMVL